MPSPVHRYISPRVPADSLARFASGLMDVRQQLAATAEQLKGLVAVAQARGVVGEKCAGEWFEVLTPMTQGAPIVAPGAADLSSPDATTGELIASNNTLRQTARSIRRTLAQGTQGIVGAKWESGPRGARQQFAKELSLKPLVDANELHLVTQALRESASEVAANTRAMTLELGRFVPVLVVSPQSDAFEAAASVNGGLPDDIDPQLLFQGFGALGFPPKK